MSKVQTIFTVLLAVAMTEKTSQAAGDKLPTLDDVRRDVQGTGELDKAARTAAALMWLETVAGVMHDTVRASEYGRERQRVSAVLRQHSTGGACFNYYELSPEFVREIVDKYFSPDWQSQHRNGPGSVWLEALAPHPPAPAPFPSHPLCLPAGRSDDNATGANGTGAAEENQASGGVEGVPPGWLTELPAPSDVGRSIEAGVDARDTAVRLAAAFKVWCDVIELFTGTNEFNVDAMPPEAASRWHDYRDAWTNSGVSSMEIGHYYYAPAFRRAVLGKSSSQALQKAYWNVRSVIFVGNPSVIISLSEMPSVKQVLALTESTPTLTRNRIDLLARQAALLNRLVQIVRTRSGTDRSSAANLSAEEQALAETYAKAATEADGRGESLLAEDGAPSSGPESYVAKWAQRRAVADESENPSGGAFPLPGHRAKWSQRQYARVREAALAATQATLAGPPAWKPPPPAVATGETLKDLEKARSSKKPVPLTVFGLRFGEPVNLPLCPVKEMSADEKTAEAFKAYLGLPEPPVEKTCRANGEFNAGNMGAMITSFIAAVAAPGVTATGFRVARTVRPEWLHPTMLSEALEKDGVLVSVMLNTVGATAEKPVVRWLEASYGAGRRGEWSLPGLHVEYQPGNLYTGTVLIELDSYRKLRASRQTSDGTQSPAVQSDDFASRRRRREQIEGQTRGYQRQLEDETRTDRAWHQQQTDEIERRNNYYNGTQ